MGLEKEQRPVLRQPTRHVKVFESTAASTALVARDVISLVTTTTGAPVVYTLAGAPKVGDEVHFHATTVASSSLAPFHINMGASIGVGASTEDMLTLAITGDGAHLIALSSTRWAVVGSHGAAFSSST